MHTYRPEIDGLRTIAVVPVLLYHAGFSYFSGGFLGVDVFFVISGYLITSIILNDHEKDKFSLIEFYERRARRILPALYLVMFLSIPFACHLMLSHTLYDFAGTLIATTLCSSNIYLWMKRSYFGGNVQFDPLVHTWSLAVEEQFYFIFSLAFVMFSKQQYHILHRILVAVAVVSLLLAQWSGNLQLNPPFIRKRLFWITQHEWLSYYLLTGRIWELLLGSLVAFCSRKPLKYEFFNEIFAFTGLAMILLSVSQFTHRTLFPSFYSLIPTVGAALVLYYGNRDTVVGRLLSMKYFTMIGLMSYSIYLWHQPLFAYGRLNAFESYLTLKARFGIVVLSILLAYLSWKFVETPFRNKSLFTRKQIFTYSIIAATVLNIIAIVLLKRTSQPDPVPAANLKFNPSIDEINNDYLGELSRYVSVIGRKQQFASFSSWSSFNSSSQKKRLLLIGDSHAQDFLSMAVANNKLQNYQIIARTILHKCQIYMGDENIQHFITMKYRDECYTRYRLELFDELIREADILIFVSSWAKWSAQRMVGTLKALNLRKNQIALVVGGKAFSSTNPMLYKNKPFGYRSGLRYKIPKYTRSINRILVNTINPKKFVNIQNLVCGHNYSCPVFTPENRLISFDGSHTTPSGAKYIGSIIFAEPPLNRL